MSINNGTLNLNASLQLKGGTSQALSEENPLLKKREIVIETDTNRLKIGNGVSYWNDLPYLYEGLLNFIIKAGLGIDEYGNVYQIHEPTIYGGDGVDKPEQVILDPNLVVD